MQDQLHLTFSCMLRWTSDASYLCEADLSTELACKEGVPQQHLPYFIICPFTCDKLWSALQPQH